MPDYTLVTGADGTGRGSGFLHRVSGSDRGRSARSGELQAREAKIKRKVAVGTFVALAFVAAPAQQVAQAQAFVCAHAWCPVVVEVVKDAKGGEGLRVTFDKITMQPKYAGATAT